MTTRPAVPAPPAPRAYEQASRLHRWLGRLLAWTRRAAARRALASLGDRERRDIGLPPRETRPDARDLLWRR